jgi:hypothetical protein
VVTLHSERGFGPGSVQQEWLSADLAAHGGGACTLAYWHHPVFSSGEHGNDPRMATTWKKLDEAGVDIVLTGHDHDYERFAPQTYEGVADPNGIRQFVVGTGGRDLRPFRAVQPNNEVRNSRSHGVLKPTLHAASYEWEFVPVGDLRSAIRGARRARAKPRRSPIRADQGGIVGRNRLETLRSGAREVLSEIRYTLLPRLV